MARISLGDMTFSMQIVRRDLLPPIPGQSAEPKHSYTPILTTRAKAKTMAGASEFASVSVNGKKATHSFTIRFTWVEFDIRHRVRDATGDLYQILAIEEVDQDGKWMRLHCAYQGDDTVEAAR